MTEGQPDVESVGPCVVCASLVPRVEPRLRRYRRHNAFTTAGGRKIMADDIDTAGDRNLDLGLEWVLEIEADVEDPIEIGETGDGRRRIIPITGGSVSGRCEGSIIAAGADYQLYRTRRPTELVAKYAFETTEGDRVYVENRGIRYADEETSERLRDGLPVDAEDVYFCSVPRFETAAPELEWLTRSIFVATGVRRPGGVRLAVYRVS